MANFEDRIDARISEAQERGRLSDELYQKYLQFVGALEALPQDHIAVDKSSTDIHDIYGRIKPFSQWPTKSGRARSEKVWLNYNQRLQLQQAAKEGGTAPEDPTDDPDFLGQFLDTCVRTSMRMGLDKQTAFRHCSRQAKRFEQSIRGALADRGLTSKQVEEFTKELLKGMANGKTIDMKDLSVEDRQFIQDLKDSLTYKPKNESIVREDLDDKDEFGYRPEPIWIREEEWGDFVSKLYDLVPYAGEKRPGYVQIQVKPNAHDILNQLAKEDPSVRRIVERTPRGWSPVRESLEDSDEFEQCEYADCMQRSGREPKFHDAHTEAAAFADAAYLQNKSWPDFVKNFAAGMAKYGYSKDPAGNWVKRAPLGEGYHYGGEYLLPPEEAPAAITVGDLQLKVGDWIELGPVAKPASGEGLDDTDEFGVDMDWPTTPVKITRIVPGGTWAFRNDPQKIAEFTAEYGVPPMRFVVALSNDELLTLPDKSGVRWHGRPKHFIPTWYEAWWKKFGDDFLIRLYQDGELRKIDNIQEWFHAQPEK